MTYRARCIGHKARTRAAFVERYSRLRREFDRQAFCFDLMTTSFSALPLGISSVKFREYFLDDNFLGDEGSAK